MKIDSIDPDKIPDPTAPNNPALESATEYFSIPRTGDTNHLQRRFKVTLSQAPNLEITRVQLVLRDGLQQDRQTLYDGAPDGDKVKYDKDKGTLSVLGTIHTAGTLPTAPPETHTLWYHFRVEGTSNGQTLPPVSKDRKMTALWRKPQGFDHYSGDDLVRGGDDWCVIGTYIWLDQHRMLLKAINDISAEHGIRFPPHTGQGHVNGYGIDMFHFYPAAQSAGDNYRLLRRDVVSAINGDIPALVRVGEWVGWSRGGFESLLPLNELHHMIYALGEPLTRVGVGQGWAKELLRTGKIVVRGVTVLDTTLGDWSQKDSTRMVYRMDHNDHIHITLDPTNLFKPAEQ